MLPGRQYYGLVAGLRELSLDGGLRGFDPRAVRDEVMESLACADRRTVELFYGFTDIANIINLRAGRTAFDAMGNFERTELQAALLPGAPGREAREALPGWLAEILGAWLDGDNPQYEDIETGTKFERALFEAYYARCAASRCRFLREWSRFDRGLRNVVAAYTARGRDISTADSFVGDDDIVLSLARSQAADFALKGELDYIDTLMAAMNDSASALEKERTIDLIRWNKSDELAEMDSFGMPTILAYLVRTGIIGRWTALDPTLGRAMWERLIEGMSAGIEIENKKKEI